MNQECQKDKKIRELGNGGCKDEGNADSPRPCFTMDRKITIDCSKNPWERNMDLYNDSHGSLKRVKLLHQYYINTGHIYCSDKSLYEINYLLKYWFRLGKLGG